MLVLFVRITPRYVLRATVGIIEISTESAKLHVMNLIISTLFHRSVLNVIQIARLVMAH